MVKRSEHILINGASEAGWENWDEFIASAATGTVYHTSGWLRSIAKGLSHDVRVHILTQGNQIIAGAAVRVGEKFGLKIARKPWATAYNGVIYDSESGAQLSANLVQVLLRHYHHVRLVQSPRSKQPLSDLRDWTTERKLTPFIDISDLSKLWDSFDRRVRQRVRKAVSNGVLVTEIDDVDTFYELYVVTYARQGLPMPLKREKVNRTLCLALESGAVKLFLASTEGGHPAAALVVGTDSKRAYFMLAASHPVHRKTDAMTLLWWRVMQKYSATHHEIDLVGLGTPGIEKFKRAFSPTMVEYWDCSKFASPFIRSAIERGEAARKLVRKIATCSVGSRHRR